QSTCAASTRARLRTSPELVPGCDADPPCGLRAESEGSMTAYIIRRVLYAIPIALGVSIVCFTLIYLAPGNPLQTLLPENASAETIDMIKKAYGLDKPIALQYLTWLSRAITGDLGISIASGRKVSEEITKALSNTMILALGAIGLSFSLAFIL